MTEHAVSDRRRRAHRGRGEPSLSVGKDSAPTRRPGRTALQTTPRMEWLSSHRAGYYGPFGGCFVSETLVPALEELAHAFETIVKKEPFQKEWRALLKDYVGRPTPISDAQRLARAVDPGGRAIARPWLKREELCHTRAHKIKNAVGQHLLAKRLRTQRIITGTGAGP